MSNDLLPVVLGVVLVVAAAAFVLLPFIRPASVSASLEPGTDRIRLYRQVVELEFDVELGKLSAEEYTTLSAELLGQASASLRDERASTSELDEEIEREIAAARAAFAAARQSSERQPAARAAEEAPTG